MPAEEVGDWKVEYAKSGRSKCRLTGKNIPNKSLRIGEITEGDYGLYPVWYNFDDFATSHLKNRVTGKTVFGLSSLKKNDKERINMLMIGSGSAPVAASPSTMPKKPAAAPQRKRSRYEEDDSEDDDEESDDDSEDDADDFIDDGGEDDGFDAEDSGDEESDDEESDDEDAYRPTTSQAFALSTTAPAFSFSTSDKSSKAVEPDSKRPRVSFAGWVNKDSDDDDDDDDSPDDGTSMAHIYNKMNHQGKKKKSQQQHVMRREPITPEQYILGFIGHMVRTAPPEDPIFTDASKVSTDQLEQLVKDMNPIELQLLLTRLYKNGDDEIVYGLKRELRSVVSERNPGVAIVEE